VSYYEALYGKLSTSFPGSDPYYIVPALYAGIASVAPRWMDFSTTDDSLRTTPAPSLIATIVLHLLAFLILMLRVPDLAKRLAPPAAACSGLDEVPMEVLDARDGDAAGLPTYSAVEVKRVTSASPSPATALANQESDKDVLYI
ncbi:hypothetical protein HDU96_000262, partial [Phlyctochytrium bullatum]